MTPLVGIMVESFPDTDGSPAQNYYAPQIFEKMGLTGTRATLFATGVYGVVKMLSSMGFLLFAADSLGRRKSLLMSSVGQAMTLYMIGIYHRLYADEVPSVRCGACSLRSRQPKRKTDE